MKDYSRDDYDSDVPLATYKRTGDSPQKNRTSSQVVAREYNQSQHDTDAILYANSQYSSVQSENLEQDVSMDSTQNHSRRTYLPPVPPVPTGQPVPPSSPESTSISSEMVSRLIGLTDTCHFREDPLLTDKCPCLKFNPTNVSSTMMYT